MTVYIGNKTGHCVSCRISIASRIDGFCRWRSYRIAVRASKPPTALSRLQSSIVPHQATEESHTETTEVSHTEITEASHTEITEPGDGTLDFRVRSWGPLRHAHADRLYA
jgi:hypothetical protein